MFNCTFRHVGHSGAEITETCNHPVLPHSCNCTAAECVGKNAFRMNIKNAHTLYSPSSTVWKRVHSKYLCNYRDNLYTLHLCNSTPPFRPLESWASVSVRKLFHYSSLITCSCAEKLLFCDMV